MTETKPSNHQCESSNDCIIIACQQQRVAFIASASNIEIIPRVRLHFWLADYWKSSTHKYFKIYRLYILALSQSYKGLSDHLPMLLQAGRSVIAVPSVKLYILSAKRRSAIIRNDHRNWAALCEIPSIYDGCNFCVSRANTTAWAPPYIDWPRSRYSVAQASTSSKIHILLLWEHTTYYNCYQI